MPNARQREVQPKQPDLVLSAFADIRLDPEQPNKQAMTGRNEGPDVDPRFALYRSRSAHTMKGTNRLVFFMYSGYVVGNCFSITRS